MKRKGKYPSPSTSGSSQRKRQRRRISTPQDDHYREVERRLGRPVRTIGAGALEGARQATRNFNEGIAANILSGLAANALAEVGVPRPLAAIGVTAARSILGNILAPSVAQKEMNNNQYSAMSGLVQRSAHTVTGKTKVKRVKKMKLSDKFVKGVKQVMAGTAAKGTYITIKQGMVGSIVGPGIAVNQTSLGTAGTTGILIPSAAASSGSRTLFNCLSNWSTSVDSSAVAQTELNFFTPYKILDAASVLFNGKGLAAPSVTSGNLSTTFIGLSNVLVPTRPGQLKINVMFSSVDFELKNVSNRVVTMEIWECTPTTKFATVNPLAQVLATANVSTDTNNNNNILFFRDQPVGTSNQIYHEQAIDPLVVLKSYAGLPLTWKKRVMILAPDETCVHQIVGPSGVMDFSKLVQPGTTEPVLNCLLKNWSVGCIISINGDQVIQPTLAVNRGDKAAYSDNVNNRMGMPISVQMREVYKIAVPEVTGFISQTLSVGTSQTLNLRKPKIVIWDQNVANGITSTAPIQVSNEVNPLADLVGGQIS